MRWRPMSEMRLSKLMAQRGLCSRREADRMIEAGQVLVDGKVVTTLGVRVREDVKIALDSSAKRSQKRKVTLAFHKPLGVLSSPDPKSRYPLARDLVQPRGLNPAGRLDIDSTGLLILTEDGRVAKALIGEGSSIEKEYHIEVRGEITEERLEQLRFGLELDGKPLRHARVERLGPGRLKMVLKEGRKRQIRRMCELVGLTVTKLMRVRIGGLKLGAIAYGKWRQLGPRDLDALLANGVKSM